MAVDREREADGDYLSFGMQNDFFESSFELIQV